MPRLCIGLDIGSTAAKLVQLRHGRSGLRLEHFGVEPVPPGCIAGGLVVDHAAAVAAVQRLLARARPRGRDVALAVAGNGVIIKRFPVPHLQPAAFAAQIEWEAGQIVAPLQRADVLVDHTILRDNPATGEIEVLLVAAKQDIVRQSLRVAADSGLRPAVIDATAFALHNCVEAAHGFTAGETVAVLHVGAAASTVAIVADGLLAYGRDLGAGGQRFTEAIQDALGLSAADAEALKRRAAEDPGAAARVEPALAPVCEELADEVQRSLEFFFDTTLEGPLARVYLAGGSAPLPALQRAFADRLGAPVERLDPFARVELDPGVDVAALRAAAPAAAVAFGLALRREGDAP